MTESNKKRGNGFKDITGESFGSLTVLAYVGSDRVQRAAMWLCRCECGQEVQVRGTALRKGDRKSCGCLDRRRNGKPREAPAKPAPVVQRTYYWVAERQGLLVLVASLLGGEALVEFDASRAAWVCSECPKGKCDHIDAATKRLPLADVRRVAAVVAPRKAGTLSSKAGGAAEGQAANDKARAVALAKSAIERAEQVELHDRKHEAIVGEVTVRQMSDEERARLAERRAMKARAFAH